MALDASTLTIVVNSQGISDATKALNDLAAAGEKAEKGTSNIGAGAAAAGKAAADSAKAGVDAAQQAQSQFNAIIDMMTEKSKTHYSTIAQLQQQELFDGMALADKIMAIVIQSQQDRAALRQKEHEDTLKKQQEQMDAAVAQYNKEIELMNKQFDAFQSNRAKQEAAAQAKGDALNQAGQRAADYAKLQADIKALKEETDKLAAAEKAEQAQREAIDMMAQKKRWQDEAAAVREANAEKDRAAKLERDMKADGEAFTAALKRRADTVGMTSKELRDYEAQVIRTKAAQLGLMQAGSDSEKQINGYIAKLQSAKGAHEGLSLATAGSTRELIVMGHELMTGNINKFWGSLVVEANRINIIPTLIKPISAAAEMAGVSTGVLVMGIGALIAVSVLAITTYTKSAQALRDMKGAMVETGGAVGATGDALYAMSNRVGAATGEFGSAREAIISLASTGKFTADQIGQITMAAVEMEKYGGASIQKTTAMFEKLAAEPMGLAEKGFKGVSNAAMELDKQLHFLDPTVLAHIVHLEQIGETSAASKVAIQALADTEKSRAEELKNNLTPLGALLADLAEKASAFWNAMFQKDSKEDRLHGLQATLAEYDKHPIWSMLNDGITSDMADKMRAEVKSLQKDILQDQYDADAKAHQKRLDNLTNEQTIWLRNISDRMKGEETFAQHMARFDEVIRQQREKAAKDPAFAAANQSLLSDKSVAEMRANEEKTWKLKVAKPKSDGLSGVNDEISKIQDAYDIQKNLYDNQIKILDDMHQKKLMSDSAYTKAKGDILKQEESLEADTLEKEIAKRQSYNFADQKLREQNDKAINDLNKRLTIAKQNTQTKEKINGNSSDAFDAEAQAKADQISQQVITQTMDQTRAIQAKIDAYNSLPESVKAAGVTEKQMQDAITQSTVDQYNERINSLSQIRDASTEEVKRLEAERDAIKDKTKAQDDWYAAKIKEAQGVGDSSDKEVQRLTAQTATLKEKTKAQKDWEEIQAKNNAALNRSAALTKIATDQVKIWKDAGNEIEKALKSAFGNSGEAAGKMFKAFADNQAEQIDLANKLRLVKDNDKLTEEERIKQTTALQDQSAQATIGSYGNMADAAAGFFDKQSSGYKAATAISKVFHAAETAMALASIPAKLAAGAATMFAQSGWGAFAGIAAMTAAVAAFGVAVTGGDGGSMSAADQQKVQGTGTVLGSQTIVNGNKVELVGAKSDSIANSLKIMEKDAGLGLSVQNAMLDAMQQLNNSISSFATLVVQQGNLTGVTAPNTKSFDSKLISGTGAVAGGVGGAALGTSIAMGMSVAMPVLGTLIGAAIGALIGHGAIGKALSSVFGGSTTVNDTGFTMGKSSLGQIDQSGVNANQYTNTTTSGGWFRSDSHNTQLTSLGADFNNQLTMVVKGMQSTLQTAATQLGMGGDEFSKKLQSFVVDIGNVSLKGMTGDQIQQTLQNVFSKLGDQMAQFAFSDLQKYQKIGEGMLETVSRVASDLATMQQVFLTLGKTIPPVIDQSEALVTAFGSVDNLTKGVKGYVNAIYTDQQKLDPVIKDVKNVMASLGYAAVTTKDQFKSLVDSLDLTKQHDQDLFKSLMAIAPEFGQVADAADQAKQKAIDDAKSALNDAYNKESQALQSVIDNVGKFTKTLKDLRDNALLGSLSPLTPMEKYAEAKSQFDAIAKAAQGGDADAQGKFESAYNAFLQASQLVNASGDQYQKDFAYAQTQAEQTQKYAQQQVDVAQASLDALNKQVDGLITINSSVLSVTDAINKLIAAQGGDPGNQILNNERNAIESLYGSILNRHSDEAGMQFWLDSLSKGVSISQIANDMYNSNEYKGITPATSSPTQAIAPVTAIQTGTMSGQSADVVAALATTNEKLDTLQTTIATTSQQQVGAMYDSQSTAADTIVEGTSNAIKGSTAKGMYMIQER